ncbi:MAG: hypothetical protein CBC89_02575 [Euryarchaeota archaeon TMED129]|nr:MAG: hypothetical protein CBC89_02575 [Euryarchaeota archaeon TMED129]|tara:strand:- start:4010 stop:4210 length:201 start_codon:yes stop_codon:yes gene_type:complete
MIEKRRAQVKSKFYYIFWGVATVSVLAGQLYVGSGYRKLHHSMEDLINKVNGVMLEVKPNPYEGYM